MRRSTDDWERAIGDQIRDLRIRLERTQEQLARDANVAVSTLQSLERGEGSSLRTLVQVVRALDRTDWLEQLAPAASISPMALLRERQRVAPRQRVRRRP